MITPPIDMHAPTAAYTVFYILSITNLVAAFAWILWRSYSARTSGPLAALVGGLAVGLVLPPICNFLTGVWFPTNIPAAFITSFGMRDPIFDLFGYAVFFGFGGWVLCEMLRAGHGRRAVWLTFGVWGSADLVLELPFLHWGLYRYYGDQPFVVGGFPAYWAFMNGAVPVVTGALLYLATTRWPFQGNAALRVAATPAVAGGLLLVPMAPMATALHANVSTPIRYLAALVSIAISIGAVRFIDRCFSVRAKVSDDRSLVGGAKAPTAV